jgi:hypothetical protein
VSGILMNPNVEEVKSLDDDTEISETYFRTPVKSLKMNGNQLNEDRLSRKIRTNRALTPPAHLFSIGDGRSDKYALNGISKDHTKNKKRSRSKLDSDSVPSFEDHLDFKFESRPMESQNMKIAPMVSQ